MLALLKRNFILYFRNRSGVFFSLLGALISFLLYIIFLQKNLTDSWSQLPNSTNLLNNWLMGGTLAVTGMTTSFTALKQMVQDRENQVDQDLFLTDLGNWGLQASYLISSIVISFVMQAFMFAVMSFYFKESELDKFFIDNKHIILKELIRNDYGYGSSFINPLQDDMKNKIFTINHYIFELNKKFTLF